MEQQANEEDAEEQIQHWGERKRVEKEEQKLHNEVHNPHHQTEVITPASFIRNSPRTETAQQNDEFNAARA